MFPASYLPDYVKGRGRSASAIVVSRNAAPSSTNSGVVSVAALPHAPITEQDSHASSTPAGRVDTKFALPPALITCLVCHVDAQHRVLATPAIVEHCLRDLQRRLMPWVAVERVFGSMMRATVPAAAGTTTTTSAASPSTTPAAAAAIPGGSLAGLPPTAVPQAGSYLSGSHVRIQLAKTTDSSVVVAIGASVLHLLFYAVDEPESRPSLLAHIVQQWLEALKTKGEEHDCMVLLVHGDLIAASEAAARMAEEVQVSSSTPAPRSSTPTPSPAPPQSAPASATARTQPSSSTTRSGVSQDKVDAAAALLRRYYKELQDLKFSRQQVSAYTPNETPMRILERLRPAVIARGGRLRQALQIAAALKRQCPQDPSTKPVPWLPPAHPATTAAGEAAAATPRPSAAPSPVLSPRGGSGAAHSPSSPPQRQYFNIQSLWRTGYDLVVHYLQYGLVFDARETLEHLYLEYYNNSDDYAFLRSPVATLERLGRVPNLFDAHGHAGWDIGRSGYPKALEPGAELLEGLLLLAAAEMACSLLLGEPAKALQRHRTFVQVTREKFEEWNAAEAAQQASVRAAAESGAVASTTYQQFFLLQCYLSGLRMWWPTSGLCRPRRAAPPARVSPPPPPAAVTHAERNAEAEKRNTATKEAQPPPSGQGQGVDQPTAPSTGAASTFSPLRLPPLKVVSPPGTGTLNALPAPEVAGGEEEEESLAVALHTSPLLLPATGPTGRSGNGGGGGDVSSSALPVSFATAANAAAAAPAVTVTDVTSSGQLRSGGRAEGSGVPNTLEDTPARSSGVCYSMTNPSFARTGSQLGHSFRGAVGSFVSRSDASSAERKGETGQLDSVGAAPLLVPAAAPSPDQAEGVDRPYTKTSGAADDHEKGCAGTAALAMAEDDADTEATALENYELHYLMAGSEDTVQLSVGHLIELAVLTGLVTANVEPEELNCTSEAIREALACGNVALARDLQQRQRQLRRSCADVATLLEHARDSLAAVARNLQYSPFLRLTDPLAQDGVDREHDKHRKSGGDGGKGGGGGSGVLLSPTASTTVTATAFANVAELSSPAQALRLWRTLAAMAALALRLGEQRRREFHLYARLAVTFLSDHPSVAASIVADRLLPYVKTQGWRQLELFVRRLYVEAREQRIRNAGLLGDLLESHSDSSVDERSGSAAATVADLELRRTRHARLWPRVFRTGDAYALYRECVLVLISNGSSDGETDAALTPAPTQPAPQAQQQQQRDATSSATAATAAAAWSSTLTNGLVGVEDAVGALDTRLFATRTRTQWWRELLRIDAIVMPAFFAGEPPEYPLNNFTSPLLVRLEKQRPPSAVNTTTTTASRSTAPFLAANAALPLQANVEEVVRMCFAMACAVNPLVGPDGEQRLRVSSPLSARPARGQAAVRLQLTLESRKDWEDEEEPTHVVHISDCEEASYDEATKQLHVVFAFPVCHAGVYRVRRIRLCNGVTWLAHYPQLSSSSSVARRQASAGLELGQRGSSISSPFQLVTRAPLLRVAEPRSSVHLRLTLPEEAHCFADSVDYATLEVELEDPLYLTVHASPAAGGEAPSPSAPSSRLTRGVTGANREESGVGSAVSVGEAQKADHSNWAEADDEAECSCFYEASPGNLVLPLTVTAAEQRHAHSFPRRSESRLGTSFADDALELSSQQQQQQQRLSAVSPGYRALLGNDSLSVGNDSLVLSAAEGSRSRGGGGGGGSLIAAVLIGTPSVYRPKTASAVTAAAASAAARGHPGASLSHVIAPRSPDGAAVAANSASFMNRSGSFAQRRLSSHSHHNQQQQHSQHSARHRSAAPLSPAEMQLSSSARAASHPVHTLPSPAAQPLAKMADESRYKAVFKTLRIATASAAAAGEAPPTLAPTPRGDSARSLSSSHHHHHHQQSQQHRDHLPAHSLRHHGHTRSPATSERSYHDGLGSADPDGSRRAGMSFSGGAFPPGAAASGAAWHASPLHEVDAETFELVLAHHHVSAGASGGSTAASPASAKKPTTPVGAAAAGGGGGASAVARTSIPIHLRSFLRCLPPPEVQAQPLHALSAAEAKAAEALLAATPGPLLQAESAVLADPMRESVIRLRASSGLAHSLAAGTPTGPGNYSGSACSGEREGPLAAASADGAVADDGTATVITIPLTQLRLKVPLLPLLVTPDTRTPGTAAVSAEKTAASGGSTINGSSSNTRDSGASGGVSADSASAPTSSAEAARQARFTFTCMRGREPSTTSLSVAVPFQLAVSFDYAFKHFQGRVYCLVRMRNLLKKTSLWMRGAVLRVLDAEPSYEMVRVCDVYNDLLMSEWKPQEELSILYELDLIASFHPVQPECAHQVQMQVFYSSWEHCYLTTPAEDRLVLRTVQLPPTEATAESVELVDGDPMSAPSPALNGAAAAAATVQGASSGQDSGDGNFFFHVKGEEEEAAVASPPLSPSPHHPRVPTNLFSGSSASSPANSRAHNSLGARGGLGISVTGTSMQSDHSVGSITRSVTHVAHSASRNGDDDSSSSSSSDNNSMFLSGGERGEQTAAGGALRLSSAESSTAASGAVHFNVVTLRHLEEHCNSVCGPVVTFHSKHLCVFSIVMYAESPWTMRFGAATNYVARAPATPLSGTMNGSAGSAPLPRASLLAGTHSHHSSSTFSATQSSGPSFGGPSGGSGRAATADSFFGNAMVDQPSDFVFVAGEPVRFCVRLQPQAQNWPEDANMEETFFIRLKYNPAEWMVIGKQRDRRTLSLMEEVTVYFNAVPLLPLANGGEDAEEEGQGSAGTARAGGRQRSTARHNNGNDEDEEGNSSCGSDGGTGGQDTNARQDAVSAGRSGEGDSAGKAARSSSSSSSSQLLAGDAVRDEGILQTPTVEMFWERRKAAGEVEGGVVAAPSAAKTPTGRDGSGAGVRDSSPQAAHEDAVMGEAVLIDVVQFRTWVRVRKHGHS